MQCKTINSDVDENIHCAKEKVFCNKETVREKVQVFDAPVHAHKDGLSHSKACIQIFAAYFIPAVTALAS